MKTTEKYVREHHTDLATYTLFGLAIYIFYKVCIAKPKTQPRVTVSGDYEQGVESLTHICAEEVPVVGQPIPQGQSYYPLWNPPTPVYDQKTSSQMY